MVPAWLTDVDLRKQLGVEVNRLRHATARIATLPARRHPRGIPTGRDPGQLRSQRDVIQCRQVVAEMKELKIMPLRRRRNNASASRSATPNPNP
jgi:hypothetical protein